MHNVVLINEHVAMPTVISAEHCVQRESKKTRHEILVHNLAKILTTNISLGSVATSSRFGGICSDRLIANFRLIEFQKIAVNIWRRYEQQFGVLTNRFIWSK